MPQHLLLAVCIIARTANAQNDDLSKIVLQYRPEFARSLPIQILASGIVLTFVAVLLVHLVFTAQFHWSLARVNYVLQLFAVVTLFVAHVTNLQIVLVETERESQTWPYMLSYAAVYPDPTKWQSGKRALWYVMSATTTGLIQITHIQFLTLLYPSKLEVKLIYSFLIPMSFGSIGFPFLGLHPVERVQDIGTAGLHICNAAIYILFTIALFSWGLFVNPRRAWRLDGGTAVFGVATLSLSLFSTALYVLYVATEHLYRWLSGLLWTVVVWQSFLGWWWWVQTGSGSALRDLDDNSSVKNRVLHADRQEEGKREKFKKRAERRARALSQDEETVMSHGMTVVPSSAQSANPRSSTADQAVPTHFRKFSWPIAVDEWIKRLKKDHHAAAREQTVEQTERIMEMERGGLIPLSRFNFLVGHRTTTERPLGNGRLNRGQTGDVEAENYISEKRVSGPGPNADRPPDDASRRRESMLWWGPLRRWRLHDVTLYA